MQAGPCSRRAPSRANLAEHNRMIPARRHDWLPQRQRRGMHWEADSGAGAVPHLAEPACPVGFQSPENSRNKPHGTMPRVISMGADCRERSSQAVTDVPPPGIGSAQCSRPQRRLPHRSSRARSPDQRTDRCGNYASRLAVPVKGSDPLQMSKAILRFFSQMK